MGNGARRFRTPIDVIKPARGSKRTILLMGPSGVGKTHQFRTLSDGGMCGLYVDVEAKLTSIVDLDPDTFLIRAPDIPLTPEDKQAMLRAGASDFIKLCDYVRAGDHPYDFIYLDSLMRFADALAGYLEHVLRLSGYDLWGAYAKKMKQMLKLLTGLASVEWPRPVHVVATCGVEIGKDWRGRVMEQPLLDGKVIPPAISYYFDDVLRLGKDESVDGCVSYVAYTGGTSEFNAKVSSGRVRLPHKILDPNLHNIIAALSGGGKG